MLQCNFQFITSKSYGIDHFTQEILIKICHNIGENESNFSHSSISHHIIRYMVLISIFTILFIRLLLSFVSIEKIYQTLETLFHPISNSAMCRIFNSLLGVWKSDETWSLVFYILLLASVMFLRLLCVLTKAKKKTSQQTTTQSP